ncbi:MAG: hypothetical protein Q8M76_02190, partial [Spirochaetaceae bacterium]|nr:hypothetical protein [Spirochaetaceae bacterium]
LSELAMAFLMMAVALAIYGVQEAAPFSFYLFGLLTALTIPLVPLSLGYIILVPLMSAGRLLRNKNAVMIVGGILGLAAALLFNIYIQGATTRLTDHAWILENFAGPDAIVARIGSAYPPAFLAWASLSKTGLAGAVPALANLALGGAVAAGTALLFGPAYARSLLGFDEQSFKRLADKASFIVRTFRRRRPLVSLFLREVRLMNREPVYLLNGPLVPILMPLIFGVMYFVQREALSELAGKLGSFRVGSGDFLSAAAAGAFLGSSTSITCTAISRDAKALPFLKALPIAYSEYAMAKFLHGFAFAAYGAVVGVAGVGFVLGLPFLEIVGAFAIALSFSSMTNIGGLWLDTANPRLSWDNPMAALKQNPNSVIAILGTMGLIGALGALSAALSWSKLAFFLVYGGLSAAIASLAVAAYPRYAAKRIAELE